MFLIDENKPTAENSAIHRDIIERLKVISKDESVPHIIFYGPPGSGKKTIISMFLEMLYDKNVHKLVDAEYEVKGSGNSTTKEVIPQSNHHIVIKPKKNNSDRYLIQEVAKEYAKRMPLNVFSSKKVFKSVLIENVDDLPYYAQTSLRRTMEKYSGTCRFIMWSRSLSKVIDPLVSRCLCIRVRSPTYGEIFRLIHKTAVKKGLDLSIADYTKICDGSKLNIREALWMLELHRFGHDFNTSYTDSLDEVIELLFTGKIEALPKIRNILYKVMITIIGGTTIVKNLVEKLIKCDELSDESKMDIIKAAAVYEHNLVRGRREIIHLDGFIKTILIIVYETKLKPKIKRASQKGKAKAKVKVKSAAA